MKVIIFSLPNCQPCRMTKERLAANGVEFVEGSIEIHRELFRNMGFKSAPVVLVEPDAGEALSWSGYRPDCIKALIDEKPEGDAISGYTRMRVMIEMREPELFSAPGEAK
ncbi:glutaredoxin domain-containing protein [Providencia vermicola]|uniref:glutaredoxin domain-containing protein n=1 Tax=Providencia TaxID=586 RepID=UPI002ADE9EA6|nr:hypothetical protein [Morganella morganii]